MSDGPPVNAAVARNARCPCGSGKRYKDCHGAIAPGPSPAPRDESIRRRLDAALAAQQAGRLAEAIAGYEAVIDERPDLFDALHMLGVTHYQRGDFERARERVASALRVSPSDRPARHNLQLIESVLERRSVERDICREVLPRLARRCVAAPAADPVAEWRDTALDVILSTPGASDVPEIIERLAGWLQPAEMTVWWYAEMSYPDSIPWPLRIIDADAAVIPDRGRALFIGADRSPVDWYEHAAATEVALFCDDEGPCTLVDRIPELAREGSSPILMLFGTRAAAQRIGLPGIVVASAAQSA